MEDDQELPSDEEEILVFVEFEDCADASMLSNKQLHLDMLGLDTEHPIMQVNGRFFEGTYEDAIGTYMFFDKNENPKVDDPVFDTVPTLKYFAKTKKLLKMQRVLVKHHTEVFGDSDHGDCVPNLKVLQEAGVPIRYQKKAFDFWTEARNKRINALNAYLEKQRIREEKKLLGIAMDSESDEDNPFAAYNPQNELPKVGKSKVRKKGELEVEKSTHKMETPEETVETESNVSLVKKEHQRNQTKVNNEKNSSSNEIEDSGASMYKKLQSLKGIEGFKHSCKPVNTTNFKEHSEEENINNLDLVKSVGNMTSPEAFDDRAPQTLQTKVTSAKVLARRNKIFFPPTSTMKKRLKSKSSLMHDKNVTSLKGSKNIARNEKHEKQCTEGKNVVSNERELQDESKKKEDLDDSQRIRQEMPKYELNSEQIIVDEEKKNKKQEDTKCKEKKSPVIKDDERLRSQQSQGRAKLNQNEHKYSQSEEKEVNVKLEELNMTELTIRDKTEMDKNDKRLRKQEKRKEKLKEINERLKAMANNYKNSGTNVY